jgi:hypothetical protein
LAIVDLHQEEELTSSQMGKVAGGFDIPTCLNAQDVGDGYLTVGDLFAACGATAVAESFYQKGNAIIAGGCPA